MELEEVHSCEESEGKMVNIEIDTETGDTFCGYCGEKVDYSSYFEQVLDKEEIGELN